MKSLLPATGTLELLEELSPHVPDDWINQRFAQPRDAGRPRRLSAAQLWRVHLLAVLTPVHSFNLLVEMLAEQRAWRRFAHLPNRHALPVPRMLHEFREQLGVQGFRDINEQLVSPLLPPAATGTLAVALIDATDLPASARGFKKKRDRPIHRSAGRFGSANPQAGAEPVLFGLQEAHVSLVARALSTWGLAGAAGQLGRARQHQRRLSVVSQRGAVLGALAVATRCGGRRQGQHRRGHQAAVA